MVRAGTIAFYRIASRRAWLVANCPDVTHVNSRLVSPRLTVLPKEWDCSLFFCQAVVEAEVWAAGVDSAALVHDRQVVQGVESPAVVAANDKVAVVVENRPRVMDTIETSKNRLGGTRNEKKSTARMFSRPSQFMLSQIGRRFNIKDSPHEKQKPSKKHFNKLKHQTVEPPPHLTHLKKCCPFLLRPACPCCV